MSQPKTNRTFQIFRYDPTSGGDGHYDTFCLEVATPASTTIIDVLLQLQQEQDASLSFRHACRVGLCGSCAMVINGQEALACETTVGQIPPDKTITIRPLNHFPVLKDLVVDMAPFFDTYTDNLLFFQAKADLLEPALIAPESQERQDAELAAECIACGCCLSSCTMCQPAAHYAGPAALARAFTLLVDSRDAMFDERLGRALLSCYTCRSEFTCTEVCPKAVPATKAIKSIQMLALKNCRDKRETKRPAELPVTPQAAVSNRRAFLRQAATGLIGLGSAMALGGVVAGSVVGPTPQRIKRWISLGSLDEIHPDQVTTLTLNYEIQNGFYTQRLAEPVFVSRTGPNIVCFKSSCSHAGCRVRWNAAFGQFRCACHGGGFDRNGEILARPPPRPLDRYAWKLDAGQLLVEVG